MHLHLFLAADDAAFSTGTGLVADNGSMLGPVRHERAA